MREDRRLLGSGREVLVGQEQPAERGAQLQRLAESRSGQHRAEALGIGLHLAGHAGRVVDA